MGLAAMMAGLILSAPAWAEPIPDSWGLQVENDLFGSGLDRHYTNGVQAFWVVGSKRVPENLVEAMNLLPGIDPGDQRTFVFSVGQHMYTPADISRAAPEPTDRPYAGWLYASIGAVVEEADKNRLHDVSLDIGVVGPASLAGKTQRVWHALIDAPRPQGWGHQLNNEPGLLLTYQTRKRLETGLRPWGLEMDVTPSAGFAAGNIFTHGALGASVRWGRNLDLTYGAPFIRPSLPSAGLVRRKGVSGWNVFAGVEGRAVARNIFLDGNTIADSPSVTKRPLVMDFQFGVEALWRDVRLSFTQVLRTRDFDGQENPNRYGSFAVTWVF